MCVLILTIILNIFIHALLPISAIRSGLSGPVFKGKDAGEMVSLNKYSAIMNNNNPSGVASSTLCGHWLDANTRKYCGGSARVASL